MRSDAAARGDPGAGKWKKSSEWQLERQFDKLVQEPELKAFLVVIQGPDKPLAIESYFGITSSSFD